MTTTITLPATGKQIAEYDPATAVVSTDKFLTQQGGTGTLYTYATHRKIVESDDFGTYGLVTANNTPTDRTLAVRAADWVNVLDGYDDAPGAVGDGVMCDAAVTVSLGAPTVVTIAGQSFTAADIGKFISISEIGSGGGTLSTTIAGVNSSTVVVLTTGASTAATASSKRVVYGTDDAAALSAIKAAMLADRNGILLATYRPTGIVIPAKTFIIVSTSVDFTDMHGFDVSAYGAVFYGATNGKAVVDGLGLYKSQIRGLTIIGDRGLPPNVGLQIGQYTDSGANGLNQIIDVDIRGYHSGCAYYNRGSETTHHQHCTFETSSDNAYSTIMDGVNHFDYDSEYVDVDLDTDASMSSSANTFMACRMVARGSGANGVWTANAKGQKFYGDSYVNTLGKAFVFYNVGFRMQSFLFHGGIDGPATHGVFVERTGSTFVYDMDWDIHSNNTSTAMFGTSAVSGVCKVQGRIIYDELVGPLFDDTSLFELNCDVVATHTGETPTLPSVMTGSLRVTGSPTVHYNASVMSGEGGGSLTVEVTSAGNTGTATPGGLIIRDSSNGTGWDIVNPWGVVEFSASDTSDSGPGGRLRIGAVAEDSFGGQARMAFFTAATVGTWVEQMALASSGALSLYGASLNFAGAVTASAPTNGMYIPASNTLGWAANSTQILTGSTTVIAVKPTTASTSTTTGALTVAGGLGVAGAFYAASAQLTGAISAASAQLNGTSNGTSGTATPFGLTIADSSSGAGWDIVNPWAKLEFYSGDLSTSGPGGRVRIGPVAEGTLGGASRLAIFQAATANTFLEKWALTSAGRMLMGVADDGVHMIQAAGSIALNLNAVTAPSNISGSVFRVTQADTSNALLLMDTFGASGRLMFRRSGGTNASRTATASGAVIGDIAARGYDGSAYTSEMASIAFKATETWGSGANGSSILFSTTANTTNNITARMLIDQNGAVILGPSGNTLTMLPSTTSGTAISFTGGGTGGMTFAGSGGVQLAVTNTASAVNYVGITGGATGNGVTVSAVGANTDIDFIVAPKGAGQLNISGTAATTAGTPASFSANRYLAIKVNGTNYYLPMATATW